MGKPIVCGLIKAYSKYISSWRLENGKLIVTFDVEDNENKKALTTIVKCLEEVKAGNG